MEPRHLSRRQALGLTALFGLGLAGCSSSEEPGTTSPSTSAAGGGGPAPEPKTLRLGFAGATLAPAAGLYTSLPQALGFWDEENLTVEVQRVDGTATALTSMVGGQLDLSVVSGEPVIQAIQQGQPFTIPYVVSQRGIVVTSVLADSDLRRFEDLEGAIVGTPTLASGAIQFVQAALGDVGVDPASVTFVAVGTGASAAAALINGQVQALADTDSSVPVAKLAGADLRELETPLRDRQVMSVSAACTSEYLEANSDAVLAWARGVAKATLWASANPEDAVRLHYEVYPEEKTGDADTIGLEQLMARLENVMPSGDNDFGLVTEEQIQATIDFMLEFELLPAEVAPADVFDDSLIADVNDFDRAEVESMDAPA